MPYPDEEKEITQPIPLLILPTPINRFFRRFLNRLRRLNLS